MTAIIDGKLEFLDLTRKSNGGTEQMAGRMIKYIFPDLLSSINIIHSRVNPEWLTNGKPNILVLHDLPGDPESDKALHPYMINRFDAIVCVSQWQRDMYAMHYGLPLSRFVVINNWIEEIGELNWQPKDSNVIRLVYHTTPHRGLEILVPVFEHLAKSDPDIELAVFSSFKVYGWEERDKPYEALFQRCKDHPQIAYWGTQTNRTVRSQLCRSHIFAYPSIWQETSCIAAIEAMWHGLTVVAPRLGALSETLAGNGMLYDFNENPQEHAEIFAEVLSQAISEARSQNGAVWRYKGYGIADHTKALYSPTINAIKWEKLITSIKDSKNGSQINASQEEVNQTSYSTRAGG